MPQYRVAHVREQGQDMVVVPVTADFGRMSASEQHGFVAELQARSEAAGMRGKVVPVWAGGFIAPRPWHPFFRTFSFQRASASCNKILSW